MKNILKYISLTTACLVLMTACSSDDVNESELIKVVSADVEYPTEGGSGRIVVDAPGTITAKSENTEWCTATVSGNIINISVLQNDDLESRYSAITIESSGAKVIMSVSQHGSTIQTSLTGNFINCDVTKSGNDYFRVGAFIEQACEFSFVASTDYPVEFGSDTESWIKTRKVGDSLYVFSVDQTNKPRKGNAFIDINYPSGHIRVITFEVTQGMRFDDLLGKWELTYQSGYGFEGAKTTRTVTFIEDEDEVNVYWISNINIYPSSRSQNETGESIYADWKAIYNPADGTFSIPNAQFFTRVTESDKYWYIHNIIVNVTHNSATSSSWNRNWSENLLLKMDIDYDSDEVEFKIASSGQNWSNIPHGFVITGFSMQPIDAWDTFNVGAFFEPVFVKLD